MPHQCTTCGRTFPDGSKEMLSGCPDCGGNKFQFKPASAVDDADPGDGTAAGDETTDRASSDPTDRSAPTPSDEQPTPGNEPASTPDEARDDATPTTAARTSTPDPTPDTDAPSRTDAAPADSASPGTADTDGTEQIADRNDEDTAQASARSDVVSPDELDRASRDVEPDETPPADEPQPGIDALRDELNDQFESIRIVSPGQYELNLMELYDRQEYIISLQEDGRYVIEMPDAWGIQDE